MGTQRWDRFKMPLHLVKVTLTNVQSYSEKDKLDDKDLITKKYLEEALDSFKIKVKANTGWN